jgi:hypothetical protein
MPGNGRGHGDAFQFGEHGGRVVADADSSIVKFSQAWADLHGAPTLVFWLNEDIDREHVEIAYSAIEDLPADLETLWIVLSSSGGQLDASFHIAKLLQARCKNLKVVIPRWAKSAATMMALGCDEIVMHPLAELGPLDAQLRVRRRRGRHVASALDAVKSIEYLRLYASDTHQKLIKLILNNTSVDEEAASSMASSLVGALMQPVFAQVDPAEMGLNYRLLLLAEQYGTRLMERPYADIDEKQRLAVLRKMVSDYAAHSFVIDLDEAKGLGLKVRPPSAEETLILKPCVGFFVDCDLHHPSSIAVTLPSSNDDSKTVQSGLAPGESPIQGQSETPARGAHNGSQQKAE